MKLSAEAAGGTRSESLYRRFQNFFLRFAMPLEDVGRLVLSKLPRPADGWVLSMDRTNWKYGKTHINILVVAVVINKVAVPVVWMVLPQSTKRGISHADQRIRLMARLLRLLPAEEIKALTMDREFVTHMSDGEKIEKLFAVLTLAFLVSYGWGCEMKKAAPLASSQKRKSIFRLGLDRLAQLFSHQVDFEHEIDALLFWLSSPKFASIFVV